MVMVVGVGVGSGLLFGWWLSSWKIPWLLQTCVWGFGKKTSAEFADVLSHFVYKWYDDSMLSMDL